MLTEDTLFLDYLLYAGWVLGAVLLLVGVFNKGLRVLIVIGIAVPGGGVLLVASQKVPLRFEVVIVEAPDDAMTRRHVRVFTGGEYTFGDGTRARITKPEGGMTATVVINDSNRPVRVVRVAYSAHPNLPGPGGRQEIVTIEPGRVAGTLSRIGHFGPESEGPPDSIKSAGSFETLDWLTW